MTKTDANTMPAAAGYLPAARPRYRRVECEFTRGAEGAEPFWAEIRSNLTWGEISALEDVRSKRWTDLWALMAPYVAEWNALGLDPDGNALPVPPPAEAGPDAFQAVDASLTLWLLGELRQVHLGGEERGKGSAGRESSDGSTSGDGSA